MSVTRSSVKKTIWLTRPDLQTLFDSDDIGFERWLWTHGASEYRALRTSVINESDPLVMPAADAIQGVNPILTTLMALIWKGRPDLQSAFDLRSAHGQQSLVWWFFFHGMKEENLHRFVTDAQISILGHPVDRRAGERFQITRLMRALYDQRPDIQAAFNLDTIDGRYAFACWYFVFGLHEISFFESVTDEQLRELCAQSQDCPDITEVAYLVWGSDYELRTQFPRPAEKAFQTWLADGAAEIRFPILRHVREKRQKSTHVSRSRGKAMPLFGVNLIGYAKGQFGIGEDVRMAAQCLRAAEIPFIIHNVEAGANVSQNDESVAEHISAEMPFTVNMFCTTGFETARLVAVEGPDLIRGRYNIGCWPWELADWPAEWQHAFDLVDEVWASSRFTLSAYEKSSNLPMRLVPLSVSVEPTAGLTRADFGLPDDQFLFVFSFDALSSLNRKNPLGLVRAFRQAFPRGDEPCGLVLKAMRADTNDPEWADVISATLEDNRIYCITDTFDKPAVLDLYRASDAFVSLHRSEGFGRAIAESLMLGLPVAATGYSGNLDFAHSENSMLVDYTLRELRPNEYPFGTGKRWAEPNIESAARCLKQLFEEKDKIHAAEERLRSMAPFSVKSVAKRYSYELARVRDVLQQREGATTSNRI